MLVQFFQWASIANALTVQRRHGGSSTWYCLQSLYTLTEELCLAFFSSHPSYSFMCVSKTTGKKQGSRGTKHVGRTIIPVPLKKKNVWLWISEVIFFFRMLLHTHFPVKTSICKCPFNEFKLLVNDIPLRRGSSLFSSIFWASVPASIRSSLVITPIVRRPEKNIISYCIYSCNIGSRLLAYIKSCSSITYLL